MPSIHTLGLCHEGVTSARLWFSGQMNGRCGQPQRLAGRRPEEQGAKPDARELHGPGSKGLLVL